MAEEQRALVLPLHQCDDHFRIGYDDDAVHGAPSSLSFVLSMFRSAEHLYYTFVIIYSS